MTGSNSGTDGAAALEPLRFRRRHLFKPWGGRALERVLGFELPTSPSDHPTWGVGETWELVDREKENSLVAEGSHAGSTLRSLVRGRGKELLGATRLSPGGEFPLLVKFLDAREHLSVQVHPHDAIAKTLAAGDAPKTECWYVLDAQPDAAVWLGFRSGVGRADYERAAGRAEVVELLERHPVTAGDFVFVPGGTVHAIGAGIVLAEVQQTSDTTYRIYDWERTDERGRPRPVHLGEALGAIRFGERVAGAVRPSLASVGPSARRATLVECSAFAVDLVDLAQGGELALDTRGEALVLVILSGAGTIAGIGKDKALAPGGTWLVPAIAGAHALRARTALRALVVRARS